MLNTSGSVNPDISHITMVAFVYMEEEGKYLCQASDAAEAGAVISII